MLPDHDPWVEDTVRADLDTASENAAGADQAAIADSCAGGDRCQRADTRSSAN
jgi:hypothetical protein